MLLVAAKIFDAMSRLDDENVPEKASGVNGEPKPLTPIAIAVTNVTPEDPRHCIARPLQAPARRP